MPKVDIHSPIEAAMPEQRPGIETVYAHHGRIRRQPVRQP
jgi:hypothetical protein